MNYARESFATGRGMGDVNSSGQKGRYEQVSGYRSNANNYDERFGSDSSSRRVGRFKGKGENRERTSADDGLVDTGKGRPWVAWGVTTVKGAKGTQCGAE